MQNEYKIKLKIEKLIKIIFHGENEMIVENTDVRYGRHF